MAPRKTVKKATIKNRDDRLKAERIQRELKRLPGWEPAARGKAIRRTYELPGFRAALAFVAYVGELAEAKQHHPDIDIRYNKVTLTLSTHDAGGVTGKDVEMAAMINQRG
ncbi:MAG TPA: 4a-hydroxytetrahydrobiopterin dehydratase [Thermoanaerobaculia bacterium]|nr:4a-hydroxytetrahydrobiopterin dehydratase [Thermoanaerobaculia bacterium]